MRECEDTSHAAATAEAHAGTPGLLLACGKERQGRQRQPGHAGWTPQGCLDSTATSCHRTGRDRICGCSGCPACKGYPAASPLIIFDGDHFGICKWLAAVYHANADEPRAVRNPIFSNLLDPKSAGGSTQTHQSIFDSCIPS